VIVSETVAVGSKAHVASTFKVYAKAVKVVEELEQELRARKRRAEDEFEAAFHEATKADRDRIEALRRESYEAKEAWEDAKIEQAAQDEKALPVGTVLVEWKRSGYYGGGPSKPTGRKGVVNIWTRQSDHPGNLRWGLPEVGDRYIRVLKKDGTPSRNFEKLSDWKASWLPEGTEPKRTS
jgi:hypothetical protein